MQSIVELAGVSGNVKSLDTDEKFELLLDTNDVLLDQAVSILYCFNFIEKFSYFFENFDLVLKQKFILTIFI